MLSLAKETIIISTLRYPYCSTDGCVVYCLPFLYLFSSSRKMPLLLDKPWVSCSSQGDYFIIVVD